VPNDDVASTGDFAFDRVTAVRPRLAGDGDGGDGSGPDDTHDPGVPGHVTLDAEVDAGWGIGTKPNGGYLLALLANGAAAAAAEVEGLAHPDPMTASAHYLSAPGPGPVEVRAEVLRRGKRLSQVRSRLVQDGTNRVEATFTLGRLDPEAEPWWDDAPPPPDTTPEPDCPRSPAVSAAGGFAVPMLERVELRLDPALTGFAVGAPTGRGELRGWLRFADGRPFDARSLLLAVDALPPATFDLGSTGWVPTFALTAYVRRVPAPGPLLVRQRARLVEDDVVDEACDVWDARGRLVAQATQLAGVRVAGTRPVPRR
jgi:hypothetical protein